MTPPLWRLQLELIACVALACMVGFASRPIGYLAALWPANAIMLGLLLRHPQLGKSLWTWVLAFATYVCMDWASGTTTFVLFAFNAANILGVLCAWWYLRGQSAAVLSFQRQRSVLVLFIGCVIGAAACSLLGAWASSRAFGGALSTSLALWMSGEFFNYVLFLPVFLASPRGWVWKWPRPHLAASGRFPVLPLLALMLSEGLGILIGGPGAMAFLIPALVWCAMAYSVFFITLLSVLVCFTKTAVLALGAFSFSPEHMMEAISYRTGLALLSLAPLSVACAYGLRLQALNRLNHAVNHDFLTGLLARRALMERGQKLLTRLAESGQPMAVLMVDLDHFKRINDQYGHANGDVVLQEFARIAQQALRPEDLFGRWGGEEFAIVLPRTNEVQALAVAQRLCDLVRAQVFPVQADTPVHMTVSAGLLAVPITQARDSLEHMLSKADEALYRAKRNGRDQVCAYGMAMDALEA